MDKLADDIVGVLVQHCQCWNDIYQLSLTCQMLYKQICQCRFSVPWVMQQSGAFNCALPRAIATTLALPNLSQDTMDQLLLALNYFSALSVVDITGCTKISFNKAKALSGILINHGKCISIHALEDQHYLIDLAKDREHSRLDKMNNVSITVSQVEPTAAALEVGKTMTLVTTPTWHQNHDIDVDDYLTPERIRETKRYMKYLSVMASEARPRNGVKRRKIQQQLLPLPTLRLLSSKDPYCQDDMRAMDDMLLDPIKMHTVESVTTVIKKYGTRFLESVLIFGDHWIFTTAIDGFLHHTTHIDDAADSSPPNYHQVVTAAINEKTMYGKKFFEASIYIGYLEFLIVGGFVGSLTSPGCTAFLGSSIGDLPAVLKTTIKADRLLIPQTCRTSSCTFRSLRQHAKFSADREWSFISTYYATKGFYPVTALNYSTHISHKNKSTTITYKLASFSLRCISKGTIRKDDIAAMLHIVLQDRRMRNVINVDQYNITSFKDLKKSIMSIPSNQASTYLINNITLLVKLEEKALANDSTHNLIAFMSELKSDSIMLLNDGFAAGIKNANTNVIHVFQKTYPKFLNL